MTTLKRVGLVILALVIFLLAGIALFSMTRGTYAMPWSAHMMSRLL